MAWRFYMVPKIGTGIVGAFDPFRPKYIADLGVNYRALPYGSENAFLVAADVTDPQHTSIAGNPDVSSFPQNLDAQVGANLATVQAELESWNLPGSWVSAQNTYRQILRQLANVLLFAQRFNGLFIGRIFTSGITLDTTVSQLTQTQRDRLKAAGNALGLDYSAVTGATTIRQLLRGLAQQMPSVVVASETLA